MARDSELTGYDAAVHGDPCDRKGILRFITCGSVDDGKSTLIGRLLYESHAVFDDQLAALERDSRIAGTRGGELDYALLLDGLAAEREQGITIDVAYRYFSTARRKFIVADSPGHEQYTRNMVTAASTATAAILLIDARKGALTQTRRHAFIVSLLGIRHVALAVNKMDLVGYSRPVYERIASDFREFANGIGLRQTPCIPISAVRGDNVIEHHGSMPWYDGPTLLQYLEAVPLAEGLDGLPFRMPVQRVTRPHLDFRGFAGTIMSGRIQPGDRVCVLPTGQQSVVRRIVTYDGDLDCAVANQAISLVLADELDVSRGDVVSACDVPAGVGDRFQATIVWMHRTPMLRGRDYLLKIGTRTVTATVSPLKYKINVDTLERLAADTLEPNEIGVCELELDRAIAFEPYAANRDLGGFILIDRFTNDTVGAGLVHFALRRSGNVHWQTLDVDKIAHAALKRQKPCVLWMTGVSGAGKSTIANLLERRLHALGLHTCLLDGDNVRHGLNKDLGFTEADRVENVRRVAEVAKLMVNAGLIVIAALISPFRNERAMARGLLQDGEFCEIHIDAPIEVAMRRDPKGLYAKARRGELQNFTGFDSPYEPPERPEIRIDTQSTTPEDAAESIVARLREIGVLPRA